MSLYRVTFEVLVDAESFVDAEVRVVDAISRREIFADVQSVNTSYLPRTTERP